VTLHTKYSLRCPCISEVVDLAFALPTSEATRAKRLVAGEDGKVLNLIIAGATAICAVVTDKGAIAEE